MPDLELAGQVNEAMPNYVISRCEETLKAMARHSKVAES